MNMKATNTILMVVSIIFIFGCAKETVAPNLTGTIEGRVQNAAGEGIPSVSITTNPGTDALLTNANGEFTINDVSTGNYTIQARKDSFATKSIRVAVKEDRVTVAQIVLTSEDEEGTTDGNINAKVTYADDITYNSRSGNADSNYVDVEYMVENISSTNRIGNYEIYFNIYTTGSTFNQEVKGDSLAASEQTFGSFRKYIREFRVDSVRVSGVYTPNA